MLQQAECYLAEKKFYGFHILYSKPHSSENIFISNIFFPYLDIDYHIKNNEYINNSNFNQYNFYFNLFHNKLCIAEFGRLLSFDVNSPYLFLIFTVLFLSTSLLI